MIPLETNTLYYIKREGVRWIRPLFEYDDVSTAMRQAFENIIDESMMEPRGAGCFTVNAAVECAPSDTEVTNCLLDAVAATEACFYTALTAAQARSELAAELNARALAGYFINAVRALRVMARLKPDRSSMQAIVDVTLSVLG
jgi:TetR/AcrR family transcriptional repressor of nem operon